MANRNEQLKQWVHGLREDVGLLKEFVASPAAPAESKALAAGALNYLVTQMDLIPDWEDTAGTLDDAMVVRVAMALGSDRDLGALNPDLLTGLGRLANEADAVSEILGTEIYQKLTRYVRDLSRKEVRRRMPQTIVDDERTRRDLYREVDDELKTDKHTDITDPEKVIRIVKSYLVAKLKAY